MYEQNSDGNYDDEFNQQKQSGNQFDFLQMVRTVKNVFVKRKMDKRRKKILRRRRKQMKRQQGIPVSSDSATSSSDLSESELGPVYQPRKLYQTPWAQQIGGSVRDYMPPSIAPAAQSANHYCFQCSRPLTDVRQLNCGHAFCSNCLDSNIYGGTIQCPVCHQVTNLRGVAANTLLPPNDQYSSYKPQPTTFSSNPFPTPTPTASNYSYTSPLPRSPDNVQQQQPSPPPHLSPESVQQETYQKSPEQTKLELNYQSPRIRYVKPEVYRALDEEDNSRPAAIYEHRPKTTYTNRYTRPKRYVSNDKNRTKTLYVDSEIDMGDKVISRVQEVQCPSKFARSTTVDRLIEMLLANDRTISPSNYVLKVKSSNGHKEELSKKMTLADCDLKNGETLFLKTSSKKPRVYEDMSDGYNKLEDPIPNYRSYKANKITMNTNGNRNSLAEGDIMF